jgi:hypothetical protein
MKHVCMTLAMAILCLAIPALMLAQDNPILGTWKLNLEKSKFTGMPTPKSLTRTVSADGDSVKYSYQGTGADGSAADYAFTVKYDGNDYAITGSTPPFGADQIAIKKLTSHKYSAILKKGGKAIGSSTVAISADGKTTTLLGKGTLDGKAASSTQVYDKQ